MKNEMRKEITYLFLIELFSCPVLGSFQENNQKASKRWTRKRQQIKGKLFPFSYVCVCVIFCHF